MTPRDFRVWEDDIIPIYLVVGTEPFSFGQIRHIIRHNVMTRYSAREYIIPVKGPDGRRLYTEDRKPLWRLNPEVATKCTERLAAPDADYRWENLAKGLTGGSECV